MCEPWNVKLSIKLRCRYSTTLNIAILMINKISLVMLTFYISQSWSNISKLNDTVCHGDGVSASIASSALNMASTYFGRTLGWLGRKLTQWRIKNSRPKLSNKNIYIEKPYAIGHALIKKCHKKQYFMDGIFFHNFLSLYKNFCRFYILVKLQGHG